MFTCPSCAAETPRLVIYQDPKKLGCPQCGTPKKAGRNVGLGQTTQYYVKKDGSRGRITTGKAWEIEHRKMTPEGVVINEKTGKETQY